MSEDHRRVRFASIDGIGREDLALAREVWLEDLVKASWASREAMKLGAHFMRYMAMAAATVVSLREIEVQAQLTREDVRRALTLMQTFGAISSFSIDRDEVKVALVLSLLQRLRVLETRRRFNELLGADAVLPWHAEPADWEPVTRPAAQPAAA